MSMTRRAWLEALAATAGAFAAGGCLSGAARDGGRLRLACQLWSVNDLWRKDLAGTLARLAALGYEGVQSMAFWKWDRKELHGLLDANGLRLVDMPITLDHVSPAKLSATLDFCREFGIDFLFVPHFSEKKPWSDWVKLGEGMCAAAATLAPHGIRMGFHNHQTEFRVKSPEGMTAMELFMRHPELVFELDVGHVKLAGGDPVAMIGRLSGRIPSIHAKPGGGNSVGGEGDANDWSAILPAARRAGVKWAVVECEERRDRFDDVEASARFLAKRI